MSVRTTTTPKNLRILIAEDSPLFAEVLIELLHSEPDIQVVALATNGVDAHQLCQQHRPDLVLMDIHMPRLDGLSATELIMADCPTPILVITADPQNSGVDLSFRALSAGALDLIAKPDQFPLPPTTRASLIQKIRLLAQIPVVRHVRGRHRFAPPKAHHPTTAAEYSSPAIIGVVASTGGPRALARICADLPADLNACLLIVQHITDGFTEHLARWLNKNSPLSVSVATKGAPLLPGHIYLAPTGYHLSITSEQRLHIDASPPLRGHRPSGDHLLASLAKHAPHRSIGLILSGMGDDGARGLASLHKQGCPTIVQDEDSSVVFGMPRAAIHAGVVNHTLPDSKIAARLIHIVNTLSLSPGDQR